MRDMESPRAGGVNDTDNRHYSIDYLFVKTKNELAFLPRRLAYNLAGRQNERAGAIGRRMNQFGRRRVLTKGRVYGFGRILPVSQNDRPRGFCYGVWPLNSAVPK